MEPGKRQINGSAAAGRREVDYGYDTLGKRLRRTVKDEAAGDKLIAKWNKNQFKCGEVWARLDPVEQQSLIATLMPEPDKRIYPNETGLHLLAAVMHNPGTQKIIGELVLGCFGAMRPATATE